MPEKLTTAIETVSDRVREWTGDKGTMHFVGGSFADGSAWESGTTAANKDRRIADLKALIGQTLEFEVEPRKEYQGQKQWKLVSWPGKVQPGAGGGFGGKREYVPRWKDTEEGTRAEQDSIHRSVALTQAVAFCLGIEPKITPPCGVLDIADQFYEWLSKNAPPQAAKAAEVAAATPGVTTADKPPAKPPVKKSVYEMYLEAIPQYKNLSDIVAIAPLLTENYKNETLDGDHYRKLNSMLAAKAIEVCPTVRAPAPAFRACEEFLNKMHKDGRLADREYGQLCIKFAATESQWQTATQAKETFG